MKKKWITLLGILIALAIFASLAVPVFASIQDNTTCYKYYVTRRGNKIEKIICQVSKRSGGSSNPPAPTARPPQPTAKPKRNKPEPEPTARPVCVPTYKAPTIAFAGRTPPYPIVIGQDPDKVGVDFVISASGGRRSNDCLSGPDQRTITFIDVSTIHLAPESIARINGELASSYPGAAVKDSYPLFPQQARVYSGTTARLNAHFDPLDPGSYLVTATARQDDGQFVSGIFSIPVSLLEGTLSW